MDPYNWEAGYKALLESYFDFLQRGELDPARGLACTAVPGGEIEEALVAHLVACLRRAQRKFVLLDWRQAEAKASESNEEFRDFFGRLWELQHGGLEGDEAQVYLERLNHLMRRSQEADSSNAAQVILFNLPPIAAMGHDELERLRQFLAIRSESNLPLFVFFREPLSELWMALQRASDIIWALEESTYPGEFYLLHPHGFRAIMLQNRRRALSVPIDSTNN